SYSITFVQRFRAAAGRWWRAVRSADERRLLGRERCEGRVRSDAEEVRGRPRARGGELRAPERSGRSGAEIAVALWHALPTFRGGCAERTFVIRVAHNRALTHVARRRASGEEISEISDG